MNKLYNIFLAGYFALSLLSPVTSYASTEHVIEDREDVAPPSSTTSVILPWEVLQTEIAPRCQLEPLLNLSMTCKGLHLLPHTFEGPLPRWLLRTAEQENITQLFSFFPKLRVLAANSKINLILDDHRLSQLTNLTKLDHFLEDAPLTDVGLTPLTNLIDLHLYFEANSKISNNALLRMTNLTALSLGRNQTITGAALTTLTALRILDLCDDDKMSIRHLNRLPNLTDLSLAQSTRIRGGALSSLISLRKLVLFDHMIIKHANLSLLTNLTELQLKGDGSVRMKNAGERFAPLSALIKLTLSNVSVTDADLVRLPNLMSLYLALNKKITGAGLRQLTALRMLRLAHVETIQDADVLQLTSLDSLELGCGCTRITEASLSRLTNLTWLGLAGNLKVTDAALAQLTDLRVLYMSPSEQLTGASLFGLPNFTTLYVPWSFTVKPYRGTSKDLFRKLIDQKRIRIIGRDDTDWQDPSYYCRSMTPDKIFQ